MSASPLFSKVALLGCGLIGSSLARALVAEKITESLSVYTRREETAQSIRKLQLANEVTLSPAQAVADADLVVFCTPLGAYEPLAQEIAPHLSKGSIVTDVGSVKEEASRTLAKHLPKGVFLIPGHPVAGTEKSGPEAGFASLFQKRWTILTPLKNHDPQALAKVRKMWERCGCRVEVMEPRAHDELLALSSHLPHVAAYALMGSVNRWKDSEALARFSAGGLRDFTRIADSNPWMWRDILLQNREHILAFSKLLQEDLATLVGHLEQKDGQALLAWFQDAKGLRKDVLEAGQARFQKNA